MQTKAYIYNMVVTAFRQLLPVCLLCLSAQLHAQLNKKYTDEHPLIIICDWDFPPYEFSNDNGQPDGYNVDLYETILKELGLPYKFVMKESDLMTSTFLKQEADLMTSCQSSIINGPSPYHISRCILDYRHTKVAMNTEAPAISSLKQISSDANIVLKSYDNATRDIMSSMLPGVSFKYHSVNESLIKVHQSKDCFFVWDERAIQWFIREMNLIDINVVDVNIPASEVRIVGYDKQLIDEIDDQYTRLEQSGKLERIQDKWFHPERQHNDASPVAIYVALCILVTIVVLLMLTRLAKNRAKAATRKMSEIESMMLQSLSMSKYSIIEYDSTKDILINRHGHVLPENGVSRVEILDHIHPDEQPVVSKYFKELLSGEKDVADLNLKWRPFDTNGTEHTPIPWKDIHGHALVETDDQSHSKIIVCAVKDVTDAIREEKENNELGSLYTKIFDTSMVAMSFYSKEGWLIDLNEKMRELCGINEEGEHYFRETNLFDVPLFREDLTPKTKEEFHVCQHVHYSDVLSDRYLEVRVQPVFDHSGDITYYTITARDVTNERNINMEQRRYDRELNAANKQINAFEQQMEYLLQHCDMLVWEFNLQTRHIRFSRSLSNVVFSDSRDIYLSWMVESEREQADRNLIETMMQGKDFNAIHHFTHTPVNDGPCWYALSGMPAFNSKGQLTGYFGLARDISKLMLTQEKLRQETQRADESGKLKSVFLANMTHEIRTPLNAIVGFSDLLQMVEAPEERREFIRIIRNNCDMLIRLINDIIEASNIGHGPLAIEAHEVDFAVAFNDVCQTLAQRVQEPGVEFIIDNPYTSFLTRLDKGRMQQIITNFTTNAVKYTRQGHIKVGYCYLSFSELKALVLGSAIHKSTDPLASQNMPFSGIYMYCEDTGAGIPLDKQSAVFDRFVKLNDYVQGTGLGLSICKSIAERCGGRIGVNSKGEGQGSTFWIWIPCPHLNPATTS